jgi:DNA-binding NtrC family response regulator
MATEQTAFPPHPVLIVDDDEASRLALVVTLRSAGVTNVQTVADSTAVPQMLAAEAFSLVLLDLNMPGLSGQEVLQKTSDLESRPPFIIVTGSSRPRELAQGACKGVVDYLVKPVERDRLVRAVRTALAQSPRGKERSRMSRG